MKVKDIMHHDATWVGPGAPLPEVTAHIRDEDVVPINEYDRLVGEVTKRDITLQGGAKAKRLTARDVMSRPIIPFSSTYFVVSSTIPVSGSPGMYFGRVVVTRALAPADPA